MSNKATLQALFQTGDVPTGSDFADLINSCVNQVETAVQTMAGALNPTELITARVSAGNGIFTGVVSAADIYAETVRSSALATGNMSVTTITVGGDVSANSGTVFTSAVRFSTGIVSAAGTAQATGAALVYTVNIGAGVSDGQTTGFRLGSNQAGRLQYIINGGASANLWPPTGGQINALSSNAAFPMAASVLYTIIHTLSSGYAVK